MYPVLILRSEVVCLVILVFLTHTARSYNIDSKGTPFARVLRMALTHVLFDIITVLTVNNLEIVPGWVNWICHVIFILSAILFSWELVYYVFSICYPRKAKRYYGVGHALALLYLISLSFLRIEYVTAQGTNSSAGPAVIVGYALGFSFIIAALVILFTHLNILSASVKTALLPMMILLLTTEIFQAFWRSILFTGASTTIVSLGFFFSLESPVEVFRKTAMTDALSGVRSRDSFEKDMEKYDRQFRKKPGDEYTFVFVDLNDLRHVNDHYGHTEGDNYITLVVSSMNRCMEHASAVYRIGGDDFLIVYYKTDEETVEREIQALQSSCAHSSRGMNYTLSVSCGYARSSDRYKSLRDVVKSADYSMFRNKTEGSKSRSYEYGSMGTRLNYSGLTDKMFDALCASNDRNYPFITNLSTNVTRIAPGWREYFGLEDEFYQDFCSMWVDRIQTDYRTGFLEDIAAVINGHRKYHNYDYLAARADGEYVRVSCHGSLYRDSRDGTSYFTGFIVNHGIEDEEDPVTGLRSFNALTNEVCKRMDAAKPFSVIKLQLNNFARVNMLYGYGGGNEIIRKIAGLMVEELRGVGEVFCQNSVNFSILVETDEEKALEEYYSRLWEKLSAGVDTEMGAVPVLISGGAVTNSGERREIELLRGGLVFAQEESHYSKRNRLVFYRALNKASTNTGVSLLSSIHADAMGDMNYFRLRYQPIVDVKTQKTVGAEALLRWVHPLLGEVPPGKFIDFLENDPCYYRLGLGILERAVQDAKELQKKIPEFRINVNITALQLQNENFANDVMGVLQKYDYRPDALVLELTERCKEMDSDFLARRIAGLRSRGIFVAFDDLGTGYSTISLLMDIPVDEIKLDRSFVIEISKRENYQLFVRSLVLGSSSSGNHYTICFEGIEDRETVELVSGFGSFLAQGYYFARPLFIEDFHAHIDREFSLSASEEA